MIWRYIGYALLAAALVAAIVIGVKQCKQIDQENKNVLVNAGIDKERSQGQGEVLNHVEKANDAARAPTNEQLDSVCNKYDRNCAAKSHK
jgi:hypothetical protein